MWCNYLFFLYIKITQSNTITQIRICKLIQFIYICNNTLLVINLKTQKRIIGCTAAKTDQLPIEEDFRPAGLTVKQLCMVQKHFNWDLLAVSILHQVCIPIKCKIKQLITYNVKKTSKKLFNFIKRSKYHPFPPFTSLYTKNQQNTREFNFHEH